MSNNKISSEYNRVIVAELAKTYLVSKEYTERPECDVVSQDTLMIKRRIRYYIENVIFAGERWNLCQFEFYVEFMSI